jgi:outer membrane lipoprotein-sorting protein
MKTRHVLALFLSIAVTHTAATVAAQNTADEVVDKHFAALGGRAAIAKITSRRATGKVAITTPTGDLPGTIELTAKAPNKTRALIKLDLTAAGMPDPMVIDQKFDGTAAWVLNSMQGDTAITGNRLDNMRNNAFPSPLMNYRAAGATLELLPRELVGGKQLIVLRLSPKLGSSVKMYFDPETFMLVRTWAKVTDPELGELEQTSEVSDYRDVGGVKVPFKVINANNVQTVTVTLEKVEHNVAIDDAMFTKK